jgi:2-polyprenyl-6-methoxyphenol hydroxylase-like FAD-dependent oxidoreductase
MDRVEVSNAEPMLKRSSPFEVAIIGGGFAGSILAAYLLRSGAVGDMRVRLIERDTRLGASPTGRRCLTSS